MFKIRPTFFHFLIRRLGKTLVTSPVGKSTSVWLWHLVFDLLDDLMLLSSEALRRRNLSSNIIFLLEEMLSGFCSSSSHQARALKSSFLLFWYFLAGFRMFRALSASFFDFSPTLVLESLTAGVEGRLLRIPFTGVGVGLRKKAIPNKWHQESLRQEPRRPGTERWQSWRYREGTPTSLVMWGGWHSCVGEVRSGRPIRYWSAGDVCGYGYYPRTRGLCSPLRHWYKIHNYLTIISPRSPCV